MRFSERALIVIFACAIAALFQPSAPLRADAAGAFHDPSVVKAAVESAFPNARVMTAIAECESNFRQYADSGNPLRGVMTAR